MNRDARTITIPLSWTTALILALTCALFTCLAIGAAPAYAADEGASAVGGAAVTDPAAGPETGSNVNSSAADTSSAGATNTVTTNTNASANNGLVATAGPSTYARDNNSDDIFIGLAPVKTETEVTAPYGDLPTDATITPSADAVYVGITSKVGDGVDLAVTVDYLRVNSDIYGENDTAILPMAALTSDNMSQQAYDYFVVSWYYGDSPLAQGTYYSDQQEYLRVTGSTTVGSAKSLSTITDFDARAYVGEGGKGYYDSNHDWHRYFVPSDYYRFTYERAQYYARTGSGGCALDLDFTSKVMACQGHSTEETYTEDQTKLLFFEQSGSRVITAQATYVREIINNGNASYIVYASVPVVFYIDVQPANQGTFVVNGQNQAGQFVDINSLNYENNNIPEFEGYILKKYKHLDDYAGDSCDVFTESSANYVMIWEGNTHKDYAAAGTYKVVARHKAGAYKTLVATFTVEDDDFANGATVTKTATLQAPGDPDYYWVKFIDEDGTPLGDPQRYEAGATITSVPTPTKAQEGRTKYVHYGWTAVETDRFESPLPVVAGNVTYKAWYSKVPLDNIKSANGVSASGGLIDQQPAAGDPIASYELAVTPLDLTTIPSAQYGVTIIGPNNTALNAYKVHITQHNHDGSTAWLTTNVGAINLTLKVDGVADGTNVRIVQIHDKDAWDANDKAGTFTYTGIVQNGEVTITLPGKMSTFVVTTDLEAQGQQEGTSDGPSGDTPTQGDAPSGSTIPEQSGDSTNTNTSSAGTPGQEAGAAGDNANTPAASGDEAVTRGMPAAGSELGADGILADGPGEDADVSAIEGVKAAPGADEGKMPETGDSPVALLVLVALAALACVAATRKGVMWARSRR